MQQPLLISTLLTHAERHHGEQQIVSRRVEGDIHRQTYRELAERSRRMANALAARGVQFGDRVATLAWNGYRHMELYYAVSGSGAVLHTLNPRLHPDQVVWIADHAEDQVLFFDLTLPAAGRSHRRPREDHQGLRRDDRPRAHAGDFNDRRTCCATRTWSSRIRPTSTGRASTRTPPPRCATRRAPPATPRACCTATARPCCTPMPRHCPTPELLGARRHPAGGADVPRQRLGHALCGVHGRRQAGVSRPAPGRQEPARAVRDAKASPSRPACRPSGRAC